MHEEKSESSPNNLIERSTTALAVERVDPSELDTVARILAVAYFDYPIHIWAMPNPEKRLADSVVFFTFYLGWMRRHSWDVFATADRSAVVVARKVHKGAGSNTDSARHVPTLIQTKSPMKDFFEWIETFRPKIDHRYPEFFGCLPDAPRGTGFFLLANVLKIFDQEGLPVWTWTSNPRNLPFYRRIGFEIGAELRRDANTPPVTIIWRPPPIPIAPRSTTTD